ncbi:TPA: transposase [Enterobacter ludwigii]|nr:transposase [Enterobacter ludwigii]HDR2600198.1 transposase [Enterobacter ludwigii]
MSDIQKNVVVGRRKGCPNYPPEFKQRLVASSCESGISISKFALENGINTNLLFKWRQHWRQGKLQLPASSRVDVPQLLPIMLDAETEPANQSSAAPNESKTFNLSCEIALWHGTLRLDGAISEQVLTRLIQELKR